MNKKMNELKAVLKIKAAVIKEQRNLIKETQRAYKYAGEMQWELIKLKKDYRHHHIAYSELRGKTRDQIERPNEDNLPNEYAIAAIKEQYENVCSDAA